MSSPLSRPAGLATIPSDRTEYDKSPRSAGMMTLPIPGSFGDRENAVAGPSTEVFGRRGSRTSELESSSAPPTPSVIALTHPSQFIHTHHPRRGSMTPLGLHVISPVAPFPPPSPVKSIGFSPGPISLDPPRRGSTASTCSTLTQSRPLLPSISHPPGFNRERRRSSLTPSLPTLAPPSPTRAHVSGRMRSRPSSSDGNDPPPLHSRTRTTDGARPTLSSSPLAPKSPEYTRRGSLPHLGYGGWAPQKQWNPSLPPQRPSITEDGVDTGFKFGSTPSPAAAALRSVDFTRRDSVTGKKKEEMDVFEQAEAEEADRQRKAFLAATHGGDGKRARERLSIGGPSAGIPTPGPSLRRQSLMLWEKLNMAKAVETDTGVITPSSAPPVTINPVAPFGDLVESRRGSLPVAIPGGGLGRSPVRRQLGLADAEDEEDEEDDDDDDNMVDTDNTLHPPQRPLPPLLPLSDPGPRLLPSTLALHRANHLLTSRNLQAEPLPHPLPPSLHPPAPVDLAEFDIDFILAGSSAQLGGDKASRNAPIDVLTSFDPVPPTPTLQLGKEDEDTFAKFVGQFDDEYGDRRGEWTFRACQPGSGSLEWESVGAGKYQLVNGQVRSAKTGCIWQVRKSRSREYTLDEVKRGQTIGIESTNSKPTLIAPGSSYILTSKSAHQDYGGVKQASAPAIPPKLRLSMSDGATERTARMGSADSGATTKPPALAASLPHGLFSPKKMKHDQELPANRGRPSISGPSGTPEKSRQKSRDREEKPKEKGIGGVLRRGIMGFKASTEEKKAAKEEREREKAQSQSWSPSGTARAKDFIHPSGKVNQVRTTPAIVDRSSVSSGSSGRQDPPWLAPTIREDRALYSTRSSPSPEMIYPREAKAWSSIPEEAVAMVIPIESEGSRPTSAGSVPRSAEGLGKQALMVWFVPFNSEDDRPTTGTSSSSSEPPKPAAVTFDEPSQPTSGSLPKFQKLLRRRTSKDNGVKREVERPPPIIQSPAQWELPPSKISCAMHPLPFRSFRVVARVVDVEDLRVLPERSSSIAPSVRPSYEAFRQQTSTSQSTTSTFAHAPSSSSDSHRQTSQTSSEGTTSTAPTSTIIAGRTFPTVIAVCHSRSQGVEFVLEGLDRLGFCVGESAWGPTGYEEWRGSGLSGNGRELLDLLWAGCTGVMGLSGA